MKYYDTIADSGLPNTSDTIAGSIPIARLIVQ